MPLALIPVALIVVGVIISLALANAIASHLDGTAQSATYSDSIVKREQAVVNLIKQGVPASQAQQIVGPPPQMPKGMSLGLPVALIGGGALLVLAAIFGKRILAMVKQG